MFPPQKTAGHFQSRQPNANTSNMHPHKQTQQESQGLLPLTLPALHESPHLMTAYALRQRIHARCSRKSLWHCSHIRVNNGNIRYIICTHAYKFPFLFHIRNDIIDSCLCFRSYCCRHGDCKHGMVFTSSISSGLVRLPPSKVNSKLGCVSAFGK